MAMLFSAVMVESCRYARTSFSMRLMATEPATLAVPLKPPPTAMVSIAGSESAARAILPPDVRTAPSV